MGCDQRQQRGQPRRADRLVRDTPTFQKRETSKKPHQSLSSSRYVVGRLIRCWLITYAPSWLCIASFPVRSCA